jgi:hypothetical protein
VCGETVTLRKQNGQMRKTCSTACQVAAIDQMIGAAYRKIGALEERRRVLLAEAERLTHRRLTPGWRR